ncbi:MAG TPA: glycosyltransferase family 39 protein [Chloroflexia bacterium]|nr:glycosyltransferase family 39 protein [Chloroflexia bacterium]
MHTLYDQMRGGTTPMLDLKERALVERIVAKDALKFGFAVWLAVRLTLSIWGIAVMAFSSPETYPNVLKHYPHLDLPSGDLHDYALGLWNVYDTSIYTQIADNGYDSDPDFLTAFFPGYPLLIKLVSIFLLGNSLLAAIVVSNIAALIFFWYLYRLVEADYGEAVAKRAVIISAVFPTSFFLFMGYTEAPLLAFTVAAFYYARQHKWWLAGVLAGGAALIKQPGVLLIVPLGYMYWKQYLTYSKKRRHTFLNKLEWVWLLLCPIAAGGYYAYRYLFVATSAGGLHDLGANELITLPGVPLYNAFLAIRPDNPLLPFNVMDICFAIVMIGLVIGVALKIRSTTFSLHAVLLALVSLSVTFLDTIDTRPEIDMPRRVLIIFPIFIYLALAVNRPRAFRIVVYFSSILYLCLTGLFINWFFVS